MPNEIVTARKEVENENQQKLCHEMDQMYIEQDFGIDRMTGYQLCSQVARVRLANMVDILYSVVAKFPKKFLPQNRESCR